MTSQAPVLIVGGSGQIGQHLTDTLSRSSSPVIGTYFRNPWPGLVQLDASNPEQVMEVVSQVRPRLIINASNAQGGADACEKDPDLATRHHFENGRNLADAAHKHGVKFVQISTDYVFDGKAGPYAETSPTNPISELGRAKLKVEDYVLDQAPDSLVIRTTFVFSWTPESKTPNFAMQILNNSRDGREMRVPTDQIGNVTYSPNFCDALIELTQKDATGLFHLAGTTRCSKYDWAIKVTEAFDLNPGLIHGATTAELGQPAPRPLEAGFRLDKAQGVLGTHLMTLQEALQDMKTRMAMGEQN